MTFTTVAAVERFHSTKHGNEEANDDHGRDDPRFKKYFELACAKRPAEELYDLAKDPHQVRNVAADPAYAETRHRLRAELDAWLTETGDPRLLQDDDRWDHFKYMRSRPTTRIE